MMEAAGTGFRIPVYRLRKQFAAFVFQCFESLLCVSARNQQLAASVAIPKYVVANYSCTVTVSPKTNGKPSIPFGACGMRTVLFWIVCQPSKMRARMSIFCTYCLPVQLFSNVKPNPMVQNTSQPVHHYEDYIAPKR